MKLNPTGDAIIGIRLIPIMIISFIVIFILLQVYKTQTGARRIFKLWNGKNI